MQFLEVHNEEIRDLLADAATASGDIPDFGTALSM